MDLIERYLQAVQFWLPKEQKDDIIAELSEDLHAQIEESESALGRTLRSRRSKRFSNSVAAPCWSQTVSCRSST